MKITVLLFAQLSELFGKDKVIVENVDNIKEIISQLEEKVSTFKNHKYSIAINEKITNENQQLKEGDIIALLPPFAGG